MKNLILLIEPSENEYITPWKIANLYLNRFIIEEDAAFEIMGVHQLPKSRLEIPDKDLEILDEELELPDKDLETFENEIIKKRKEEILAENFRILDSAFKNAIPKWSPETDYHFIYAGFNFMTQYMKPEKMNSVIVKCMENLKLNSLIFTAVVMVRSHIVTKKVMKEYYKGEFDNNDGFDKLSVQDDLDSFFDQASTFYFVNPSTAGMFFLPMLTDEELLLLENKDENYLKLYADYHYGENPDVDEADMIESQSKSKFAYCMCFRFSGSFLIN